MELQRAVMRSAKKICLQVKEAIGLINNFSIKTPCDYVFVSLLSIFHLVDYLQCCWCLVSKLLDFNLFKHRLADI
jgi:hypothetical protein